MIKACGAGTNFGTMRGGFTFTASPSLSFLFLFLPPPLPQPLPLKKKKRSSSNASDWKMLHLSEYGGVEADKKGHLQLQIANKRNVPHHLHYCSPGPEFFQFFICFFQVFLFVFFMIGLLSFFFPPLFPGGKKISARKEIAGMIYLFDSL